MRAGLILAEIALLAAVGFAAFDHGVLVARGAPDGNDCHATLLEGSLGRKYFQGALAHSKYPALEHYPPFY
jgi:hypothetical protein